MDVSVIIPTYNRADLLRFTLDSLHKSHHENVALEIIVIDDGSIDGTKELVAKDYPAVKLLKNKGKGASAARNMGLEVATGKYLMYLDSDDLVGENFFDAKIVYLNSHADIDACYGGYDYFESNAEFSAAQITFKHKYPVIATANKASEHLINYLSGNYLPQNSIIWRKSLLEKIDGHDSSLGINQDVDLFIRCIFNGMKIAGVDDDTKVYIRHHTLDIRVGTANASGKMQQMLELRKSIYNQLEKYGYSGEEYSSALSSYLFDQWKKIRHAEPAIANEYLKFVKQIFWPVQIKGNFAYKLLAKVAGPVQAVNLKYLLLKRD